MRFRQRVLGAVTAACALACVVPGHALASATQDTILIDDNQLIYSSPKHVARVLAQLASLGVDRIRVPVVWQLVAPHGLSTKRPKFDAKNPNAYPAGAWDRYDVLARLTHVFGIGLYFQLAPPSPLWATAKAHANQGPILGRYPNPGQYRQFIEAIGRRYSGHYVTRVPAREPQPALLGIPLPALKSPPPAPGTPDPLPRVSYWGIWNEPNERSWLNPWHRPHSKVLLQPSYYRSLVDAAWRGLRDSGHVGDTILVGETANVGIWTPLPFIRAVYCLSSSYRPLTGHAATMVACPTSGKRSKFVAAHPGLFDATGFAHHPYAFDTAPNRPYPDPTWMTLQNMSVLERVMNRIFASYRRSRRGGIPLYLTEYGYKTNPPNPYVTTSLKAQARWLNEADYLSWRMPYVRAISQFELVDDRPKRSAPRGSPTYWSTFQTGLEFSNGKPKPSYNSFRIPIWVPSARHGTRVTLWGQLRPANHAATQLAALEYRRRHAKWTALRAIATASPRGFLFAHVAIPGAGLVRLAWRAPNGTTYYSRSVAIS